MLPLHVGGDLDPRHVKPVDDHLKTCLPCFREFRGFASMRSRLGVLAEERLPEGALEGFVEEVMARIEVGEPGPAAAAPGPAVIRWPLLPRLAAAAAVLIVCVAGWRYMSDGAITSLDRPPTANPLAPANTVSRLPAPTTRPTLDPYDASRPLQRGALTFVPPGAEGFEPPTKEQVLLVQKGVVTIRLQRGPREALGATDETEANPKRPRERQR